MIVSSMARLLLHPRVLAPLRALAGGEVCIEDVALRHMGPYDGRDIPGMTSWEAEGTAAADAAVAGVHQCRIAAIHGNMLECSRVAPLTSPVIQPIQAPVKNGGVA